MLSPCQVDMIVQCLLDNPSVDLMTVVRSVAGQDLANLSEGIVPEYLNERGMFQCRGCRQWKKRGYLDGALSLCRPCQNDQRDEGSGFACMALRAVQKCGILKTEER